ncbi:hypothetical protein CY658_00795 [Variovorax sp. RO1]|uniref:sensor histidine kinase n=1 Tax=Variovorax sp. RO1 TaxID=2066034 RepID=UPI000C717C9F|nr:ATP-binding protein [Variovorax sp. RO1]PLC05653.1 hypothetical protein CY658_00795 [Variovorax sp. RO1]
MLALAQTERGDATSAEVAGVLRTCIDDLRLVIDSLEPVEHDLTTLLGTLRYRLGRRMEAAGIAMVWEVEDIPALPWLDPEAALHVLRIVQEALANVLKHARAREVHLSVRRDGDRIALSLADDGCGCGFDAAGITEGRGHQTQHQRAQKLQAALTLNSRPGEGTRVELRLPLQRAH